MPVSAEMRIDTRGTEVYLHKIEGHIRKNALKATASELARLSVRKMSREISKFEKTGKLKASIKVDELPDGYAIYPTVPYASYVDKGTRPHTIKPKNKKVLKFKMDGRTVFASRVRHPGAKPRHFMDKTFRYVCDKASVLFPKKVEEGLKR